MHGTPFSDWTNCCYFNNHILCRFRQMTFIRISSALDQFISDFKELIVFCEHKYLYNYLGNSHNCPDITKDLLFIFLPPGLIRTSPGTRGP